MASYAVGVPNVGPFGEARVIGRLAEDAERAGWDGFFIWDHLLYHDRSWPVVDPWVAITAAALATERIRIGVLVTPVARRRPWKLARETASVDLLSSGRLIVGAGLGSMTEEFEAFGEPSDARLRADRLDEGLAVLTALWSGEPVTFEGEHLSVDDVMMRPRPVQRPRIPIWIAGRWPNRRPFRRAARWDGVMPTHADHGAGETMPPDELRAIVGYVREQRASEDPFDVALEGRTDDNGGDNRDRVRSYVDAGLTWWIEALGWWRGDAGEARKRVRMGPPRAEGRY